MNLRDSAGMAISRQGEAGGSPSLHMTDKKTEQLRVLMETAALVNSTLDPRQIRLCAIKAAMRLLDAEAGSLLLIDEEKWELFFEVALGEKGDVLKQVRLNKGEGIAGWVAEHGVPQLVRDVRADPRFFAHVDEISGFVTRDLACVPVKIKGKTVGVLEAINRRDGRFVGDDLEIMVALANQVAVALENAFLHEENLRQLTEMVAKEKRHLREKEKLIKDLHDGIGGITTNINLLSELAQKADSMEATKKALATIAELSREGVAEIRSFMNVLENREATWRDLTAEFRRHGHSMIEPHNIAFSIDAQVTLEEEQPGVFLYLMLFRIFSEALTNVVKHSRARCVDVLFAAGRDGLTLAVRDDGIGLGEGNVMGRGIANMKARAGEIGGKLTVSSGPGTCVRLEMPLPLPYPE
jgi:signal transduction histidine kinase